MKIMYWFSYFTETWYKTLLLITILITLFLIIFFLLKIIAEVLKQKFPVACGTILIALAYFSESQWCYLAVIIIIAYKGQLIDEKMQNLIKEICSIYGKNPQDKPSSFSLEEQIGKEVENENFTKSYELENKYINAEMIIEYKNKAIQTHKNVINWYKKEQGIVFEQEKDLTYKNLKRITLDGYCKTKCRDYILEIKRGFNNHNLFSIIENGCNTLKKCEEYYSDSDKVVDLYLAIVFDASLNVNYNEIKNYLRKRRYSKKYNYTVSIFKEDEDNNLTLVDGVVYLKTDVYEFRCN